jgi:flagellar basal-body rod modification protein FlgD
MIAAARTTAAETNPLLGPLEPSQPRALPTNPNAMGRDEFLKLLVAQLKNQDPMNPMDGKDMAAQLAQFSTVEQLISMNKSMDEASAAAAATADAIAALEQTQNERADELASLIEGQMAMATVGKIGVTTGNTLFVDRSGGGQVVVDTGNLAGKGKVTIFNEKGEPISTGIIEKVGTGQQGIDLRDVEFDPPVGAGKYTYRFEVATDGDLYMQVKTYTAGRITGLKYDQGNPILIIGDNLSVPMSQLTQIRG